MSRSNADFSVTECDILFCPNFGSLVKFVDICKILSFFLLKPRDLHHLHSGKHFLINTVLSVMFTFTSKRKDLGLLFRGKHSPISKLRFRPGKVHHAKRLFWLCKLFAYFIWYKSLENLDRLFWIYCNFLNSRIFCPFGYNIEKLSKL